MVLKLDPRVPLVWRDPTSLQFGIATPVAVLRDVSVASERMIAALTAGISRSGLTMVGRAAGASEEEIERLVAAVGSVLVSDENDAPSTVLVAGTGTTADALAIDLATTGARVLVARDLGAATSTDCDLAVIVTHYVVAPELHGLWLRRDVPHVAIVLRDTDSIIGPIVEPGSGPCLHCMQRYRTESDAAWPAIATQLATRRSPAESSLVSSEVAAVAARLVSRRLQEGAASAATSITIDSATGGTSEHNWLPHPECGCIEPGGLSERGQVSGEDRPGSDSPGAGHRGAVTPPPRRATTSSALA